MYDPALGRFCSRDPIGYASGSSLLQFVSSRALTRLDPSGLLEVIVKVGKDQSYSYSMADIETCKTKLAGYTGGAPGMIYSCAASLLKQFMAGAPGCPYKFDCPKACISDLEPIRKPNWNWKLLLKGDEPSRDMKLPHFVSHTEGSSWIDAPVLMLIG